MKSRPDKIINNQRGSVINVALLILILIFLVGIGLNKISTTDIKIASNMKTQAKTFYEAEAGLESASELLELNADCPLGFNDTLDDSDLPPLPAGWVEIEGSLMVTAKDFWRTDRADIDYPKGYPDIAGARTGSYDPVGADSIYAYYPSDYDGSEDVPHTNLSFGGDVRFARGSAIQMAAGYEGLGKGAAAGGGSILYDIYAMRYGDNGSAALHTIQWVHILGMGGNCKYAP